MPPHLFAAEEEFCARDFSEIINSQQKNADQQIEEIVLKEIEDSYFNVERSSSENIARWNEILLREINELPMTDGKNGRLTGLGWDEITGLYKKVARHPVADYKIVKNYDPYGNMGFCFGRAMAAHIEAIQTGLDKKNIRKIWAVGEMSYKKIMWQHHVATMVRGKNGVWYVIDPEYGRPLKMETWARTVKKMDSNGKLQFFITDAHRFDPIDADPYRPADMNAYFYNNYFVDMLAYTRREADELKGQQEANKIFQSRQ
jgi:hypothetical protein